MLYYIGVILIPSQFILHRGDYCFNTGDINTLQMLLYNGVTTIPSICYIEVTSLLCNMLYYIVVTISSNMVYYIWVTLLPYRYVILYGGRSSTLFMLYRSDITILQQVILHFIWVTIPSNMLYYIGVPAVPSKYILQR